MKITLGAKYKDRITGFEGICTGHAEYISGCNQALLTRTDLDEKAGTRGEWFDDQRLQRVGTTKIVLNNDETPGCDLPAPIR